MQQSTFVPTREDHLAMMRNENNWPAWPVLPLRHESKKDPDMPGSPLTAFMVTGCCPAVYVGNMFTGITPSTIVLPYPSFEAAVNDGWEVD